jgi:hypothetical protein
MATNLKKSLLTYPFALFFFSGALLIDSCKEPNPGKDLVCVSVPKDTSALGRQDHFIPLMSIDLYQKNFKSVRDSLTRKCPEVWFPESETFNKSSLIQVLSLPTCVGLKFYYGVKPGSKRREFRCMIVGVDSAGHDLYIKKGSQMAAQATDDDGGLEYGQCSPPCSVEP